VIEIEQTEVFERWFDRLRDFQARGRIETRLKRIARQGHFGDHKSVGTQVSELRFHFGPGYRIYFTMRGEKLVLLLAGGDKSSQAEDIAAAIRLAEELNHGS